jgi:hypothetical protein
MLYCPYGSQLVIKVEPIFVVVQLLRQEKLKAGKVAHMKGQGYKDMLVRRELRPSRLALAVTFINFIP